MRRFEILDFIKGVLILMVVVGHAIQYIIYQDKGFWTDPLFKAIYMFHMPLFMAVAGYISHRGITEISRPIIYLRAKVKSYIIPIFAWASVYQTILYFIDKDKLIGDLPWAIIHEAVSSLWFLWALFGSIVCMTIAAATGKYRAQTLLFIFIVTLFLPPVGNIYLFQYTFPFFIMGFYLVEFDLSKISRKYLNAMTLLFAILSGLCFIYWTSDTYIYTTKMNISEKNLVNIINRWAMGAITSVFAVLVFIKINDFTPEKLKKTVTIAGKDSLYIYILQGYVFLGITSTMRSSDYVIANSYVGDLFSVFIGITICWICWQIAHRAARIKIVSQIFFGKS